MPKGKDVSATAVREHGQKGVIDQGVGERDREEAKRAGAGSVPVPAMDETGGENDQHEEGEAKTRGSNRETGRDEMKNNQNNTGSRTATVMAGSRRRDVKQRWRI